MHFDKSISTFALRVIAPVGQDSTHPTQAPPQEQLQQWPSFQQHFSKFILIGM
jgi:hypothetical protein